LFRAFSSASGGGQHLAINNETEIVPHGLMNGEKLDFYSHSEAELYEMALGHIYGRTQPLSKCTSWAASLHAVLCYAIYLTQRSETWVAVIDTHQLYDVMIFNSAHLVGTAELEYQAYGRITGPGYKAVKLHTIMHAGLKTMFPKLPEWVLFKPPIPARGVQREAFGFMFRNVIFAGKPSPVTATEIEAAEAIGTLFDKLAVPVFTALLCLRPRNWLLSENKVDADLLEALAEKIDLDTTASHTKMRLQMDITGTGGEPDTNQWLKLITDFLHHIDQCSKRKREDSEDHALGVRATADGRD
jgi:hypothetical protein